MVKGPRLPVQGTLCTGRRPVPHLSPGWMAAEAKAGQDSRGRVASRPTEAATGSLPRSLGLVPTLALCCLMTFGRRKAAATDGMQHAGHPILSPWDIPLGKVA